MTIAGNKVAQVDGAVPIQMPRAETEDLSGGMSVRQQQSREGTFSRWAALLGAVLQLVFVAMPKDFVRWMGLRQKCVRGKVVVITGAASGIGKKLAELLVSQRFGAKVAILDNNLEGAEKCAREISKEGGNAHAWKCDVVDAEEVRKCAGEIKTHFGQVDIVICNAAVLYFGYTMELRDEDFKRALDVNVLGTINTIRAFLPGMEQQASGHIVAIASIAAFFGETFGMAYCPTKFAVRGVMECLRMELRDRGLESRIKCTTICPFFVRTPMILSQGIRPISRWVPFMSVERCAHLIIDAVLKEKVCGFMPPWLKWLTILDRLQSVNMQRVARDFFNTRFECLEEEDGMSATKEELAKRPIGKGEAPRTKATAKLHPKFQRRQMQDHYGFPCFLWFLVIPPAMLITFFVFCQPQLFNVPWLSAVGQFLHYLGSEHSRLMLWINIFAWAAHLGEAIVALYLTDALFLSHKCALFWFAQTLLLGFPSLQLLIKLRTKLKQ